MFQKNITLARAPTFSENPTELPSAGARLFRFNPLFYEYARCTNVQFL